MPQRPILNSAKAWNSRVSTYHEQSPRLAFWTPFNLYASFYIPLSDVHHSHYANLCPKGLLACRWRERRKRPASQLKAKPDLPAGLAHVSKRRTERSLMVNGKRPGARRIFEAHDVCEINQPSTISRGDRRNMSFESRPLLSSAPAEKEYQTEPNLPEERQNQDVDIDKPHPAPVGRPFSLPQAHASPNISKLDMKHQFAHVPDDQIEPSEWYAEKAAPPLLLTFDAFDTLYTPKDPIPEQYCALAREYGYIFTPEQIKPAFKAAFIFMSSKHPNYGKKSGTSPRRWWIRLIKQVFQPLLAEHYPGKTLPHKFYRQLYNHFSTSDGYNLYPDVLQLLSIIGLRSYQITDWPPTRTMLGIISNSDPRVRSVIGSFQQPNPQDNGSKPISIKPSLFPVRFTPPSPRLTPIVRPAHFAFATISYEADVAKPDPAIYDRAMDDAQDVLRRLWSHKRLTRSGAELLTNISVDFHKMHVGDDLEKDVIPALKAGWDAILLDRMGEALISQRLVEVQEDWQTSSDQEELQKIFFTVPVISSLMALPYLVRRERIDWFHRHRISQGISPASSMQRSMEELERSLAELEELGDEQVEITREEAPSEMPSSDSGGSAKADDLVEERQILPEGYWEGDLEKDVPDLFEDEGSPDVDGSTSVDPGWNGLNEPVPDEPVPEDVAPPTDSSTVHDSTVTEERNREGEKNNTQT